MSQLSITLAIDIELEAIGTSPEDWVVKELLVTLPTRKTLRIPLEPSVAAALSELHREEIEEMFADEVAQAEETEGDRQYDERAVEADFNREYEGE